MVGLIEINLSLNLFKSFNISDLVPEQADVLYLNRNHPVCVSEAIALRLQLKLHVID